MNTAADFSALYKKHAPDIFRFALYLSGSHSEAEDITSETFVRAWTSSERIEAVTVKAYLFTIARNLFLQSRRKQSRHAELKDVLPDPQANPHVQAQQKAEFTAVLERLQQLPEQDRAALLMRALDGMPYEDIARTLRISLASVKVKIHRARLALTEVRHA